MENLLFILSQELQNNLSAFRVSDIFIEDGELNTRSEWEIEESLIECIKTELGDKGIEFNY